MAGCECCDNFSMIDGGDEFKAFPGLKGDDGTTFYPHVSAEGVISWTNDGGKQNPDPVNIKGADGESAYEAAVEAGFTGTEAEFNAYLSNIGELTDLVDRKAGMLVDTASGAIASFVPDSTIPDLLGVSVDIEPVQAGSGDPSPDNVRPISGWDSVDIMHSGVDTSDPTTYTITLGQTVYGGTLDVTNGTLTVDRAMVDLGTLSWAHGGGSPDITWRTNDLGSIAKLPNSNSNPVGAICSMCKEVSYNSAYDGNIGTFGFASTGRLLMCTGDEHNSPSGQLVYPLATPIEITLDPVTISAIAGQTNNVWADAGDVSVEFAADIKSAIDGKQDAPDDSGTAGQVLGLDDDLNPVWLDQTGGGGGGTTNYNNLTNKPRINGVLLSGDKSAADLGLAAASDIPSIPVQSVNGETGAVVLDASDVGAVAEPQTAGTAGQVLGLDSNLNPTWVNQSGGGTANYNDLSNKPSIEGVTLSGNKTAADLGLAKASDIPAVPVQSVNGKTGAVVLAASDVGALPDNTVIPSKTSDLANDSGFVNASGAAAAAPVQSVNGSVGAVTVQSTITASGILKGNGSGGVSAATKGTDFGALAFTVTLTAAGWSNNAQTVSNANFVASGYGYIVSPASGSFSDYASAQIYADDVTVAGQMTFHCTTAPSAALTVNILRVVSA